MPRRIALTNRSILPVLLVFSAIHSAAYASPLSWQKITLDSGGDVGRYCQIAIDASGDLYVAYFRSDNGTLKAISCVGGSWQAPLIVDGSGSVAGDCDIAAHPNDNARVCYRRSDTGALWYAGPELPPTWTQTLIDSQGNVGTYCVLAADSLGNLHAAYKQEDTSMLNAISSSSGGIWQAPETVDSSGAFEGHCAIACEAGGTARISYRRGDTGSLWYAGPELAPDWSTKTAYETPGDAGRYVSLASAPDGRLGVALYAYDYLKQGDLRMLVIDGDTIGAARSIVDSIATSANASAHLDLAISNEGDWYIAYRNVIETALYCAAAGSVATGIGDTGDGKERPQGPIPPFALHQNVPNPFNPQTTIAYTIPNDAWVTLAVYDVAGRLVRMLVDERKRAGKHETTWDARDESGAEVASGVYFVRLSSCGRVVSRKVTVLK